MKLSLGKKQRIFIGVLLAFIICGFLYNFYMRYAYLYSYNSDSCSQLVRVHEMLNADLLLRHWHGMVSSYLTTSFFSAFLSYIVYGFNFMALYHTGVTVFMVEVTLVMLLCCVKDDSLKYKFMKCFMVFSIIGIPAFFYGGEFIRTVTHNEAYICLLVLYFIISKEFHKEKLKYALFSGILFWVLVGDDIVLFLLIVPLIIVSFIDWFYNLNSKKHSIILCLLSVVTLLATKVVNKIFLYYNIFGGIYEEKKYFLEFDNIIKNVLITIRVYLHYFNADFFGRQINDVNTIKSLVGVLMFFICSLIFVYCSINYVNLKLCDKLMVVSIIIQTAAFTFSNMASIDSGRYLLFCVIEMTILTGRYFFDVLKCLLLKYNHNLKIFNILILILCMVFIWSKCFKLPDVPGTQEFDIIADVLKEKGGVNGYGEYWQSNVIKVATEGEIKVSQIQLNEEGELVKAKLSTSDRWYTDYANFVIVKDSDFFALKREKVIEVLGKPVEEVPAGSFVILIYDYDISKKIK